MSMSVSNNVNVNSIADEHTKFYRQDSENLLAAAKECSDPLNFLREVEWYDQFFPVIEQESKYLIRFIVQTRGEKELHRDFRSRIEYLLLVLHTVVRNGSSSHVSQVGAICASNLVELLRMLELFIRLDASDVNCSIVDDVDDDDGSVFPVQDQPSVQLAITKVVSKHEQQKQYNTYESKASIASLDVADAADADTDVDYLRLEAQLGPWRTQWKDMCLTAVSILLVRMLSKVPSVRNNVSLTLMETMQLANSNHWQIQYLSMGLLKAQLQLQQQLQQQQHDDVDINVITSTDTSSKFRASVSAGSSSINKSNSSSNIKSNSRKFKPESSSKNSSSSELKTTSQRHSLRSDPLNSTAPSIADNVSISDSNSNSSYNNNNSNRNNNGSNRRLIKQETMKPTSSSRLLPRQGQRSASSGTLLLQSSSSFRAGAVRYLVDDILKGGYLRLIVWLLLHSKQLIRQVAHEVLLLVMNESEQSNSNSSNSSNIGSSNINRGDSSRVSELWASCVEQGLVPLLEYIHNGTTVLLVPSIQTNNSNSSNNNGSNNNSSNSSSNNSGNGINSSYINNNSSNGNNISSSSGTVDKYDESSSNINSVDADTSALKYLRFPECSIRNTAQQLLSGIIRSLRDHFAAVGGRLISALSHSGNAKLRLNIIAGFIYLSLRAPSIGVLLWNSSDRAQSTMPSSSFSTSNSIGIGNSQSLQRSATQTNSTAVAAVSTGVISTGVISRSEDGALYHRIIGGVVKDPDELRTLISVMLLFLKDRSEKMDIQLPSDELKTATSTSVPTTVVAAAAEVQSSNSEALQHQELRNKLDALLLLLFGTTSCSSGSSNTSSNNNNNIGSNSSGSGGSGIELESLLRLDPVVEIKHGDRCTKMISPPLHVIAKHSAVLVAQMKVAMWKQLGEAMDFLLESFSTTALAAASAAATGSAATSVAVSSSGSSSRLTSQLQLRLQHPSELVELISSTVRCNLSAHCFVRLHGEYSIWQEMFSHMSDDFLLQSSLQRMSLRDVIAANRTAEMLQMQQLCAAYSQSLKQRLNLQTFVQTFCAAATSATPLYDDSNDTTASRFTTATIATATTTRTKSVAAVESNSSKRGNALMHSQSAPLPSNITSTATTATTTADLNDSSGKETNDSIGINVSLSIACLQLLERSSDRIISVKKPQETAAVVQCMHNVLRHLMVGVDDGRFDSNTIL